jgi:MYXO-CTERM domain-containing protein
MKTRLPIAFALTFLVSLGAPTARAQILDVTLADPNQTVAQGTASVAFDATTLNPSTATIYLNGDSATTSSPFLTVNDTPSFNNVPPSLAPGQSSGAIELFDLDLATTTPTGSYALNTFSILGGADGGMGTLFQDLAEVSFSVTVTPQVGSVPEPGPLLLGTLGAFGLFATRRRRLVVRSISAPPHPSSHRPPCDHTDPSSAPTRAPPSAAQSQASRHCGDTP